MKVFKTFKTLFVFFAALSFFVAGALFLWVSTLEIPTLSGFELRDVAQSTKIYARDGKTLLFDVHKDIRRTYVPLEKISRHIKNATIAIEDSEFYKHKGIRPKAILRAVLVNLKEGGYKQGGSTITQQVIKNALLNNEKTIKRKIKEWILALKLERRMSKDKILEIYLNEAPYGGNILGVEEASRRFFNVSASDVSLAQAAYLAALPKAPSYYSPYGPHKDELERRKNIVLSEMYANGFINEEEYRSALNEKVEFQQIEDQNIKAPHFVFYVIDKLAQKYGEEAVFTGGLSVVTTLDWELQKKAQEIIKKFALENEEKFNAENAALVAIDVKNGHVLAMVGSRDYFDEKIDGKYNVATALRQPGSTFKPIVYSKAFEKGYTPSTVLFDVKTQFSTACSPSDLSSEKPCYAPKNYDGKFRGPMTLRDALAQSVNIPAVKLLYLVGLDDALDNAFKLGIHSLKRDKNHYGLTLVLGGGEVSLLELTNAYATLANDGVYNKDEVFLKVQDAAGNTLYEFKENPKEAIDKNAARMLTDVLSDNEARAPSYGRRSFLYFENQDVAAKTGTTNDFRDVWVVGYTPKIAVGTWAGNNDNSPIVKKVAGFVIAPMWRAFMDEALKLYPGGEFREPEYPETTKAILDGVWLFPEQNPPVHSILHWVKKDDPQGEEPSNPSLDPMYKYFEYGVLKWFGENKDKFNYDLPIQGGESGAVQTSGGAESAPFSKKLEIKYPKNNSTLKAGAPVTVRIKSVPIGTKSVKYRLNGTYMGAVSKEPYEMTFVPQASNSVQVLELVAEGEYGEQYFDSVRFFAR